MCFFCVFSFFCLTDIICVDERPRTPGCLSFAEPSASTSQDPQPTSELTAETPSLARELFGGTQVPTEASAWNPLILDAIQTESRGGLNADVRTNLLAKYEVNANLQALLPPKLNKELAAVLTPSVIKRDEYQAASQAQVGACLNAFGSGMSILLRPEILQLLNDDARTALSDFSNGIHLLADHNYRLSLARRAFAKPSLNIIGKTAADSAPIDSLLFGQNFTETLRAAQACEKTGREMVRETPQVGKKSLQPIRQSAQRRSQIQPPKMSYQGNRQPPVRPRPARQTGTPVYQSRRHRAQSQSRSRPRYRR